MSDEWKRKAILYICPDPLVFLQTRQWILEQHYTVDAARRLSEAEYMLTRRRYDLVILCYSLTLAEQKQLSELVREKTPQSRILALTGRDLEGEQEEAFCDEQICVQQGPYAILSKVESIVGPVAGCTILHRQVNVLPWRSNQQEY
jgi:CheY-like chemotaxis protein